MDIGGWRRSLGLKAAKATQGGPAAPLQLQRERASCRLTKTGATTTRIRTTRAKTNTIHRILFDLPT